ncbi:glycosyltransferase family 4 protein [Novosphingobium sp. 9]|uniref:glycosyltransferase family 4 protein n=1 Tax=Novosphingobium sp. 9 TaxID=2025349 RepID=UPI0021B50935|nr:glycosyltransferase family 4 protein [Novosphingobium sp. 9]
MPKPVDDRRKVIDVLQLDPSLFTAPYDAALSRGLIENGVRPVWATRRLRPMEEDLLAAADKLSFFYPLTDGPARRAGSAWKLVKGLEHVSGLRRFAREADRFDLVHVQWAVLPLLDVRVMRRIRRERPVVMTAHDIQPFNGKSVGVQGNGYAAVLEEADRLIVHTEKGREALLARGIAPHRIHVVPHGPLSLSARGMEVRPDDGRWRVVLFGRLQPYKGADRLVEALGMIDPAVRARLEIIVAGEAQMPIEPILERARELNLGNAFSLRAGRLSEEDMAALLRSADAFVFPYRTIDASGVLHMVADLNRWLIASDLGAFRSMIGETSGELVEPDDLGALAGAIVRSIGRKPTPRVGASIPGWEEIGAMTRHVYEEAIAERRHAVSI